MSEKTMKTRVINKHDTEANWLKATNFIPKQGEFIIYDVDDNYSYERFKIGDGQTLVNDLPFASESIVVDAELSSSSENPVQNKVINEAIAALTADYNETIIGLSVNGQTVTYIKGDGSVHSFETQDTDTTYSLGTDEVTGLTKLYATVGSAEDGTMTQKAIKTELDKKVGVTTSGETLVFVI